MSLVQVQRKAGVVKRVKASEGPPVVELHLEDNETIVAFDIRQHVSAFSDRKTTDWYWQATIASRL